MGPCREIMQQRPYRLGHAWRIKGHRVRRLVRRRENRERVLGDIRGAGDAEDAAWRILEKAARIDQPGERRRFAGRQRIQIHFPRLVPGHKAAALGEANTYHLRHRLHRDSTESGSLHWADAACPGSAQGTVAAPFRASHTGRYDPRIKKLKIRLLDSAK